MENDCQIKGILEDTDILKTVGDLKKWLEHVPDDKPLKGFLKGDFGGWEIDLSLALQEKGGDQLGTAIFYCDWNMSPALDQEFGEFVSCKNAVASGNMHDVDGEEVYGKELWDWVKTHR